MILFELLKAALIVAWMWLMGGNRNDKCRNCNHKRKFHNKGSCRSDCNECEKMTLFADDGCQKFKGFE